MGQDKTAYHSTSLWAWSWWSGWSRKTFMSLRWRLYMYFLSFWPHTNPLLNNTKLSSTYSEVTLVTNQETCIFHFLYIVPHIMPLPILFWYYSSSIHTTNRVLLTHLCINSEGIFQLYWADFSVLPTRFFSFTVQIFSYTERIFQFHQADLSVFWSGSFSFSERFCFQFYRADFSVLLNTFSVLKSGFFSSSERLFFQVYWGEFSVLVRVFFQF